MKSSRLLLTLTALTLLGAGCSSSSTPTPVGSGSNPSPTPSAPAMAQGSNCDHPYYPLKQGTKLTYATHTAGHDSTYVYEVKEATDHSAKVTYTFGPSLSIDSDYTCDEHGIRASAYLNMASAMSAGQVTSKTISSSGELLPHALNPGTSWNSQVEVETTNNMPQAARMGMTTGHMQMFTTSTAIGEESVTVPAGTFTAMKVESKILSRIKLGTSMPAIDKITTTKTYYVQGKGVVKSDTNDGTTESTMEATEIIVP